MSKGRRRLLFAVLPIGIALLVLWVVWALFGLVFQPDLLGGAWWVSGAIGLVTALLLIATGVLYRRDLARRV